MVSLTLYDNFLVNSYQNALDVSLYTLNYTYSTYVSKLNSIYNISYYVNFFFKFFFFLNIFYFIFFYSYKLVNNVAGNQDLFSTVFDYFSETEEEVGSLDDMLVYSLIYLTIAVSFLLTVFFVFFFKTSTFLIILFNFILLTPALVPTFVIKSYGWGFLQYLRGVTRTSSMMFEGFLDLVSTVSMYLRFFIQNIRFFFTFLAFFECYEFIYLTLLRDFSFLNILALDFNLTNYSLFFTEFSEGLIFTLLIKLALILYYVGHLSIVFVAQIANYFVLSFWLFFFLYTSFSSEKGESYFLTRRTI